MASDPILSPAQRKTLTWGIIAFVIVILVSGGLALLSRSMRGFLTRSAAPRVTQDVVVQRLREVARLVASEMTLQDVVTYEQTTFHSTKRTLLVVTARVAAGIDLSHGTDVSIDSMTKRISISLPPAQIMSVDVVNVTTYDESAGLWNPFNASDRDVIQQRIRSHLLTTARQSGILDHADQSAAKVLTELLSRDGYVVEIKRPPLQLKPTG